MIENLREFFLNSVMMICLSAVISYLCGCLNGAILISRTYLKEDVRTRGSGNAGLTNFYRNYGPHYAALVLALDALKMVAAIFFSCILLNWSCEVRLWGGLFCVLGHIFPVTYKFKGGKGVLSGISMLMMVDWRIGLICMAVFAVLVAATRYISLGSIVGAAIAPVFFLVFYPGNWWALVLITMTASLLIWSHRSNIRRLLTGTESKFSFRK